MNIYVGNLSFKTTEDELREAFGQHGQVDTVNIIMDKETNQPRGFGFVEMPNAAEAQAAIAAMNGKMVKDRELRVNESRPKADRPARRN